MMKKNLALSLTLAALSSYGVLTSGCMVPVNMPDSVNLTAEVRDYFNQPMPNMFFDYYMDVHFHDGSIISLPQDAKTDYRGIWNLQSSDLDFYTTSGSYNCYNTCVGYDSYGCYKYANDCYSSQYTYSLDVSDISYATTAIGAYSLDGEYLVFPSSYTKSSGAFSLSTYTQSDVFNTSFITLPPGARPLSAGLTTQSLAGKNAGIQAVVNPTLKTIKTRDGQLIAGMKVRAAKPEIVKDLSLLNAEEMSRVIAARKTLKLPAASIK